MFGQDEPSVDPITQIRGGVARLAEEDRAGWPAGVLSDQLVELLAVRENLDAEILRAVGRWDAVSAWADDGALCASAWLAERAGITRSVARRMVRTAGLAFRNDGTGDALAAGKVTPTAVETMASLVGKHESVFTDHEESLLQVAQKLDADEFVIAMRHWRSIAADNDDAHDPYKAFERRYLCVTSTLDGSRIDGFLDPEAAALLTAALDALDAPDPEHGASEPRSSGQRRADALVDLARESLALQQRGGRIPPNIDAVLDVNTLIGDAPHALIGDAPHALIPRHAIGGVPINRATIERLCCDAHIGRVIMAGESIVLDLGRRSRLVTAAQMRALIRRDGHCRFPGCRRPPIWTDAHHLVHWINGGTTDLDNLVLLCRRHHVMCHEGRWTLRREPDGTITKRRRTPSNHPPPRGSPDPPLTLAA